MTTERKVAVVTGASQGIGAGLVRGFLDRGCRVVANSRSITPDASADVLAVAKAKPGTINCASTGPGTQAHLGCAMLKQYGGVTTPLQASTLFTNDLVPTGAEFVPPQPK